MDIPQSVVVQIIAGVTGVDHEIAREAVQDAMASCWLGYLPESRTPIPHHLASKIAQAAGLYLVKHDALETTFGDDLTAL